MFLRPVRRGLVMSLMACVALCISAIARTAEAKWLKVESSQFIVYTDGGEKAAREFISDLHEYDALLRMFAGTKAPPSPAKLPIYLVRNNKEIREIEPSLSTLTAGFYRATPFGTIAVAMREDDDGMSARTVLMHEYAHYFMLHYYPASYPAWYVEGFAEYFGATEFKGGILNVGAATPLRAYSLLNDPWDHIKNILAPAQDSKTSKQFYEESWLMVNYMMADPARRKQLTAYLKALASGEEPEKALIATVGMDFDALDKALRAYLRKGQLPGFAVTRDKTKTVEITTATLPPGADAFVFLSARLQGQNSAAEREEIVTLARKRASGFPGDAFALATLAGAEIQAGDYTRADAALAALEAVAPHERDTSYLKALRYISEGAGDHDRRDELWALARKHAVAAHKIDQNHYPSLYIYALAALSQEDDITENTLNTLLLAQELAASVETIRLEAAIALTRTDHRKEAVNMLLPLANSSHAPRSAEMVRELITRIQDGGRIGQPLNGFYPPIDETEENFAAGEDVGESVGREAAEIRK